MGVCHTPAMLITSMFTERIFFWYDCRVNPRLDEFIISTPIDGVPYMRRHSLIGEKTGFSFHWPVDE